MACLDHLGQFETKIYDQDSPERGNFHNLNSTSQSWSIQREILRYAQEINIYRLSAEMHVWGHEDKEEVFHFTKLKFSVGPTSGNRSLGLVPSVKRNISIPKQISFKVSHFTRICPHRHGLEEKRTLCDFFASWTLGVVVASSCRKIPFHGSNLHLPHKLPQKSSKARVRRVSHHSGRRFKSFARRRTQCTSFFSMTVPGAQEANVNKPWRHVIFSCVKGVAAQRGLNPSEH